MRRAFFDRFMVSLPLPVPVASYVPPPAPCGNGLWTIDRRLQMPGGMILPSRSTLVRLRDGRSVVISAPPLDPGLEYALREQGGVAAVVAPNSFIMPFLRILRH